MKYFFSLITIFLIIWWLLRQMGWFFASGAPKRSLDEYRAMGGSTRPKLEDKKGIDDISLDEDKDKAASNASASIKTQSFCDYCGKSFESYHQKSTHEEICAWKTANKSEITVFEEAPGLNWRLGPVFALPCGDEIDVVWKASDIKETLEHPETEQILTRQRTMFKEAIIRYHDKPLSLIVNGSPAESITGFWGIELLEDSYQKFMDPDRAIVAVPSYRKIMDAHEAVMVAGSPPITQANLVCLYLVVSDNGSYATTYMRWGCWISIVNLTAYVKDLESSVSVHLDDFV